MAVIRRQLQLLISLVLAIWKIMVFLGCFDIGIAIKLLSIYQMCDALSILSPSIAVSWEMMYKVCCACMSKGTRESLFSHN
jgi:hypothetical protein